MSFEIEFSDEKFIQIDILLKKSFFDFLNNKGKLSKITENCHES